MVLCKDCKYYRKSGFGLGLCQSPDNGVSVVDGKPIVRFPEINRREAQYEDRCGPDAKWFTPKTEPWYKALF